MNKSSTHIILTASRLPTQVNMDGWRLTHRPLFRISKAEISKEIVAEALQQCNWLILSSINAVTVLLDLLEDSELLKRPSLRIAAIGNPTADYLSRYNLPVHFIPSYGSGQLLAEELPQGYGKQVFIPNSALSANQIKRGLKLRGFHCTSIPIYYPERIHYSDTDWEISRYDLSTYLAFCSSSQVKAFFEDLPIPLNRVPSLEWAAIGETTASTLAKFIKKKIIVPANPSISGLLEEIKDSSA